MRRAPLAVIICALNEEANLANCLRSVQWADQLFVVDAGSVDATCEIASSLGARVVSHQWTGYSNQKNWALDNLKVRHQWALFLDADEHVSDELVPEIERAVTTAPSPYAGYYLARRMIFMGCRLNRTWWYPDYTLRLFLKDHGRFENRLVHETVTVRGSTAYLNGDIIHDDHRDLAAYVSRLNRYSSLEAIEIYAKSSTSAPAGDRLQGSIVGAPIERRRFLKENIWYKLPMRPAIRFVWTMIFRLGFLDGREGLIFTLLHCVSDWHTSAKLYELRTLAPKRRDKPNPMPDLSRFRPDRQSRDEAIH